MNKFSGIDLHSNNSVVGSAMKLTGWSTNGGYRTIRYRSGGPGAASRGVGGGGHRSDV